MKDVSWTDFLLAVILAPVLVLPVLGFVYLILFVIMDVSSNAAEGWASVTIVATCAVEGLILAAMYKGEDSAIEHGWAWFLVAGVIAAAALIPYSVGAISRELALSILSYITTVAWVFLIAMLAVFINNRWRKSPSSKRRRADLREDSGLMQLRRL